MLIRLWRDLRCYAKRRTRSVVFTGIGCLILLVAISFKVDVLAQPSSSSPQPPTLTAAQTPDLGRHFRELGLEGSILIHDSKQNRTYEHNPQRNAKAMIPASTFKIFNAMVALETGIMPDDVAVLTWDGVHRNPRHE